MKTIRVSLLALTTVTLATCLFAQNAPHTHDHSGQKPANKSATKPGMMDKMMDDKMMAHCKEMMQKHDQMQADMKGMDDKLDGLVATMNTATGSEKTESMAAVLNEMIVQRKGMREKMSSMQGGMMQHMMEHMAMGKASMSMCPMMQEMQGMQGMQMPKSGADKPDAHAQHHQQ